MAPAEFLLPAIHVRRAEGKEEGGREGRQGENGISFSLSLPQVMASWRRGRGKLPLQNERRGEEGGESCFTALDPPPFAAWRFSLLFCGEAGQRLGEFGSASPKARQSTAGGEGRPPSIQWALNV